MREVNLFMEMSPDATKGENDRAYTKAGFSPIQLSPTSVSSLTVGIDR